MRIGAGSSSTLSLLTVLFQFLRYAPYVTSYSINIAPGKEECFLLPDVKIGTACSGSYEIISNNVLPIEVVVRGPPLSENVQPLYEAKYHGPGALDVKETEGSFSFTAKVSGDYTMCMSNGKEHGNDGLTRLVAFNFRALVTGEEDYEYAGLETELSEMRQGLEMLKDHQSFMNQREDVHKEILEGINLKVLTWTIVEAVILVGMSIWQISYISKFFETKRKM